MGIRGGPHARIESTNHCHALHSLCLVCFPIELIWLNQNRAIALNKMKKITKREGRKENKERKQEERNR